MDKRLLTIQDISCVGQCSLTVALPVISACGIETAVLPSSVLSTHTAGFSGYTFRDLTGDMPAILGHWKKEQITFDAFYTGYVSKAQIPLILRIMEETARPGALRIVDPVMADNGKLYAGFDADFPQAMRSLCAGADVILPNLTEAAFLLGEPYAGDSYSAQYIEETVKKLAALGAANVVLTGVSFDPGKLGCAVYDGRTVRYYFNDRLDASMHGTGDVYASAVAGALCRGWSVYGAAALGADMVVEAMKATLDDKDHWYGVKFERALPYLMRRIEAGETETGC
ncbi:MAG: pyridoxamine kinase [Spirochaetes bacterium]|uniref:pyridoxal kinase n=1 Tax=Candidatus Avitreponema avistercoris TaxID=2840705 RepID=A0A9D9EM66_9SPIR|nr:pyridoxamine kinase [Candidatus Avitreponema avistercoris]